MGFRLSKWEDPAENGKVGQSVYVPHSPTYCAPRASTHTLGMARLTDSGLVILVEPRICWCHTRHLHRTVLDTATFEGKVPASFTLGVSRTPAAGEGITLGVARETFRHCRYKISHSANIKCITLTQCIACVTVVIYSLVLQNGI